MPKVSPIQNAFNSGEISSLMYGRSDFAKFKNALKTCIGWVATVEGPLLRAPGTKLVREVKDSSKTTRLIKFEFSVTQAYQLEFGDNYIRVHMDHATVIAPGVELLANGQFNTNIAGWTDASTGASVTSWDAGDGGRAKLLADTGIAKVARLVQSFATTAGHTYRVTVTGCQSAGVSVGTTSGASDVLASTTGTDFTADFVSPGGTVWVNLTSHGERFSGTTGYISGVSVTDISANTPYEIVTTYTQDDVFDLEFTQSADTLYIAHQQHPPAKLTRSSHTSWTLSDIAFQDGPYLETNTGTSTLTAAATTGSGIVITASAITDINDGLGFKATDVGRSVRIKTSGAKWGWGTITEVTDTTHVKVTIVKDFGATTATATWRLGLWSATTRYPAAVTFYEDRLVYGGSYTRPQTINGSRSGAYENYAPTDYDTTGTVANDHAYAFTLNSRDVQMIKWLNGDEKGLMVGTVRGEWIVRASSSGEALSPTNVVARQSTNYGSNGVSAVRAGKAALFITRNGRKLREFAYDYTIDGFRSPNMTVLSSHITRGGIVDMAYQQDPHSIVWAARADGVLLAFTYDREQNQFGWTRRVLGGFSDVAKTTAAVVESVSVIPEPDGEYDELWMVVRRSVNGATVRYIEYMTRYWEKGDVVADASYLDCGLTYDGVPASHISGLDHLVGETVSVLADGAAHPDCVVAADGSITLALEASKVQVGLPYNSDWETLRFEAGAADGTAEGKTQRFTNVNLMIDDTLGVEVGPDFDNLTPVTFRRSSDAMSTAVPLYSGATGPLPWDGDYGDNTEEHPGPFVCGRVRQPFPAMLQAIMPQLHTQDR